MFLDIHVNIFTFRLLKNFTCKCCRIEVQPLWKICRFFGLFELYKQFNFLFVFLKKICPLFWNNLSESIKSWWLLVFADTVFLLAVVSSSVFPNKIENVKNPYFIAFLTLVIAIVSVYPIIFISINIFHCLQCCYYRHFMF